MWEHAKTCIYDKKAVFYTIKEQVVILGSHHCFRDAFDNLKGRYLLSTAAVSTTSCFSKKSMFHGIPSLFSNGINPN